MIIHHCRSIPFPHFSSRLRPHTVAAQKGHTHVIRILGHLEPRILATPNFYGTTPCFVAAEYGHVEILRLLGVGLIMDKLKNNSPINDGHLSFVYAGFVLGSYDAPRLRFIMTRQHFLLLTFKPVHGGCRTTAIYSNDESRTWGTSSTCVLQTRTASPLAT